MRVRNYGLDLARILAILGIVVLHVNGAGGTLNSAHMNSVQFWIIEWIEILAFCSVNVFAMLSGYLGIQSTKRSSHRALELLSISVFYCLIITLLFCIFVPNQMNLINLISGFFPIIKGRYWYLYCYIPLALMQPYINKWILSITIKQQRNICVLFVFFTTITTAIRGDIIGFNNGYSFPWLCVCYFIGAYIKRNEESSKSNGVKKWFFLYFALSFMLLIGNYALYVMFGKCYNYFVSYTSPFVLMMGICVLIGLKNLKMKDKKHSILILLSNLTFDVYLLHCHILIYDLVLNNSFSWISEINVVLIPFAIFGSAILIAAVCLIPAYLRSLLYKKISLKKASDFADKFLYSE